MRIIYILLYYYENEFRPQMMKKTQKNMQLLNYWMNENAINDDTLRYDILNNETMYLKNLLKQNYLFHRNYNFKNS